MLAASDTMLAPVIETHMLQSVSLSVLLKAIFPPEIVP